MKRLSFPLLVLIFIILIDLLLVVVYFERDALSNVLNSVIPGPKVSVVSEVNGLSFSIANENLLIKELNDLGFFDSSKVVVPGTLQRVTVKKVVFKLVTTEQDGNRFNDTNGNNTISVGASFSNADKTITINMYFSPETISVRNGQDLSKYATSSIMVYVYSLTGNFTTDPSNFVQQFGIASGKILKKGVLFNVRKE